MPAELAEVEAGSRGGTTAAESAELRDLRGRDRLLEQENEVLRRAAAYLHPTAEGKLYLCAVKDALSNRIVGYSIDTRMRASLAVDALEGAVARRTEVAGCVLHTDRGSQSRSRSLVRALDRHGMVGSMGRVGAAGDNAAMESFFSLLQKNVLDRRVWATRTELRIAIAVWIERTYHRRRRQEALGKLTSIEYETIMARPAQRAVLVNCRLIVLALEDRMYPVGRQLLVPTRERCSVRSTDLSGDRTRLCLRPRGLPDGMQDMWTNPD